MQRRRCLALLFTQMFLTVLFLSPRLDAAIFTEFENPFAVKLFGKPSNKISQKFGSGVTFLGQESSESLPALRSYSKNVPSFGCSTQGGNDGNNIYGGGGAWRWRLFPDGFIFPSLLAGVNEHRLGGVWNYDEDQHWLWDITLGGRAPILRYGNKSTLHPEGWQFDIEGSVHLRLDLENEMEMDANDFRFGLPISYGNRVWQVRFGYYHVSSHMGDERMLRLAGQGLPHRRINYVREALIFGYAYRLNPAIRIYGEADFAFERGEDTNKWHFQFGIEYSRPYQAGRLGESEWHGSPFAALNVILLEEHKFDGNITVQAGWQWRGPRNQLLRCGLQYFGGVSEQYEHIHARREHKIGFGVWYDF